MAYVANTATDVVVTYPRLSWRAIIAGWLVATAVAGLLYVAGMALGFAAFDATDLASTAKGVGIGTGIWFVLTWATALFLGGMAASWFDNQVDHTMGALQGGPQPRRQLEVTQVVGGELHFVTARIAGQRHGHDARTVDQDVQRRAASEETFGESIDGGRIGEVHRLDFDIDALESLARLGEVASRDDDAGAGGVEGPGGFGTDTRVATGHDGGLAGQVDAGEHLVRRAGHAETGVDGGLDAGHGDLLIGSRQG